MELPLTVLDSNLVFFPKVYNGLSFVNITVNQTLSKNTNTITSSVEYPDSDTVEQSGLGSYLVDAKITSSAATPAGTQIKIEYSDNNTTSKIVVLQPTAITFTAGETKYLSSLPLPIKQTTLNQHKGLTTDWYITITGVAPINSIITVTPVIYSTTAKLNEIELTK